MGKNSIPKPRFSVSEICQWNGKNVQIVYRHFNEEAKVWIYKVTGAKEEGTGRDIFGDAELTRIIHRQKKHHTA